MHNPIISLEMDKFSYLLFISYIVDVIVWEHSDKLCDMIGKRFEENKLQIIKNNRLISTFANKTLYVNAPR